MKLEKEIARWWMMPTQDRIPPSSSWKFDRYGRDFWSTDHVLLYWNLGRCGPLGHSNKRSVIFFGFVLYSRPRGASSSREESPSPFFSNRVGNWGMIVYDAIGAISLPPHLSLSLSRTIDAEFKFGSGFYQTRKRFQTWIRSAKSRREMSQLETLRGHSRGKNMNGRQRSNLENDDHWKAQKRGRRFFPPNELSGSGCVLVTNDGLYKRHDGVKQPRAQNL